MRDKDELGRTRTRFIREASPEEAVYFEQFIDRRPLTAKEKEWAHEIARKFTPP